MEENKQPNVEQKENKINLIESSVVVRDEKTGEIVK